MNQTLVRSVFTIFFAVTLVVTTATIKLPALIADNMVLQQNTKAALWGWANPGEVVNITTSWNDKTISVTTDSNGKWISYVNTAKAGGPYTINFKGANNITVGNVLLGEVWLASGQSNMEFFMAKTRSSSYTGVLNYEQEIKEANYPLIRQIDVANKNAAEPQKDFKGDWKVCTPATADTFSAVAFYFAKEVHKATGFPIGIINSTWGGTAAESWTKQEVLESEADFKVLVDKYNEAVQAYPKVLADYNAALEKWKDDTTKLKPTPPVKPNNDKAPYRLYNAMIAPLIPYTLKGVIWYQGENNAPRAYQYRKLFPAMIANWRSDFKNPNLPFYFVQISPHRSQNPEIREAQLLTYRNVKNTGIVVTTDNGDEKDIHPRNKKLVGERLSLWALHDLYGQKKLTYSGPLYKSIKVEGNKIVLSFDNVGSGLMPKGGELTEFTIAGEDQKFVTAKAVIQGNKVVVTSDPITKPVAVRFAWSNGPNPNFYNKEGLPASPFRTDNWKGATEGRNF
ncbi:MAG: sialic acid-specific 9-O-acetylesterase [Segetibacter sp.]|nr:sialic acid-specific 9-O-acetylesterase [Segetibacter sp.]